MARRVLEWVGTDAGLRIVLTLAALVTLMGGWALGQDAGLTPVTVNPGTADEFQFLEALAAVLLAVGLLIRAVSAEEKRLDRVGRERAQRRAEASLALGHPVER